MFKRSLAFLLLLTVFCVKAETVRFRSGTLLAADLSRRAPNMEKISEDAFPKLPVNRVYASLTIRLDPGRKISIYDYSVRAYGSDFPCVAIWQSRKFCFDDETQSGPKVSLLFVLDGNTLEMNRTEKLGLKSNAPPEKFPVQKILFRVHDTLPRPDKIPDSGSMAVQK